MGASTLESCERIFITGGAGVIGRELVFQLSKQNIPLLVGDIKSIPLEFKCLDNLEYIEGDLNDLPLNIIYDWKPTVIIHLAASFERL